MFDSLTQSADGLFVLIYIIFLVIFFIFWPHKIYEAILGSLIALGCYFFIHEITFVYPGILEWNFWGKWLIENRWNLLWCAKWGIFVLLILTPITLWVNVFWVKRNTFWFIVKTLFLTFFFLCYSISLSAYIARSESFLWEVALFPLTLEKYTYFSTSDVYTIITNNSIIIFFIAFLLCLYKIIFSHWMSTLFVFGSVVYYRWVRFFSKKNNDTQSIIPEEEEVHHESHEHHDDAHGHVH